MSLILNEWLQQIADARSKREAAEVLVSMTVWDMARYHETISKRLNLRDWFDLIPYVTTMRLSMMEPRPFKPSLLEALESAAAVIDALLSEPAEAPEQPTEEQVEAESAAALDAELSAIGL